MPERGEDQRTDPERLGSAATVLAAADPEYLCAEIPLALEQTLEGFTRISKIRAHPRGSNHTLMAGAVR
jgi:hypothetical protein